MLLEMLNREVPEPFLDHCRAVGVAGGGGRPALASRGDTPEEIAGQIAVIKKFEKTLRWVGGWGLCGGSWAAALEGCGGCVAEPWAHLAVYRCVVGGEPSSAESLKTSPRT